MSVENMPSESGALAIPVDGAVAGSAGQPLAALPSLDEKDRCIQCGRQAFQAEAIRKDRVDPRWEKLQGLKKPEQDPPKGN